MRKLWRCIQVLAGSTSSRHRKRCFEVREGNGDNLQPFPHSRSNLSPTDTTTGICFALGLKSEEALHFFPLIHFFTHHQPNDSHHWTGSHKFSSFSHRQFLSKCILKPTLNVYFKTVDFVSFVCKGLQHFWKRLFCS